MSSIKAARFWKTANFQRLQVSTDCKVLNTASGCRQGPLLQTNTQQCRRTNWNASDMFTIDLFKTHAELYLICSFDLFYSICLHVPICSVKLVQDWWELMPHIILMSQWHCLFSSTTLSHRLRSQDQRKVICSPPTTKALQIRHILCASPSIAKSRQAAQTLLALNAATTHLSRLH